MEFPVGVVIVELCCASAQSAAVSKDGILFVWGWRDLEPVYKPEIVSSLSQKKVVKIELGAYHLLALTEGAGRLSEVYTWGSNDKGQLGLGHTVAQSEPVLVQSLSSMLVTDICATETSSGIITGKKRSQSIPYLPNNQQRLAKSGFGGRTSMASPSASTLLTTLSRSQWSSSLLKVLPFHSWTLGLSLERHYLVSISLCPSPFSLTNGSYWSDLYLGQGRCSLKEAEGTYSLFNRMPMGNLVWEIELTGRFRPSFSRSESSGFWVFLAAIAV